MRLSASPSATTRQLSAGRPPPRPPLHGQQLTSTDGSSNWRDNYILEKWYKSEQPVVYLGETYRGYEFLRRLGDWCWLTKDPASG